MMRVDPGRAPTVLFHADCPDGFTAAWVVAKKHPGAILHACRYGDDPPHISPYDDVFIVDFSFPREVMTKIANVCRSLVVYDHHKSAQADLEGFGEGMDHVHVVFDMDRSGAGITYDELYGNVWRPPIINHVEDRDLWKWEFEAESRPFTSALMSRPYTIFAWDEVANATVTDVVKEGQAIERHRAQQIEEVCKLAYWEVIGADRVPVVNCNKNLGSEVAGKLAEGRPFAAYYYDEPDGRTYGLRSAPEGSDVSAVAELYDGGGHAHSAGFRIPRPSAL